MYAYRQTDRHFLKMSTSCSEHLKHTEIPRKTGCRKFSQIQYFLLMQIEESKKEDFCTRCEEGRTFFCYYGTLTGVPSDLQIRN